MLRLEPAIINFPWLLNIKGRWIWWPSLTEAQSVFKGSSPTKQASNLNTETSESETNYLDFHKPRKEHLCWTISGNQNVPRMFPCHFDWKQAQKS